jgi:hypothetical protein
MILFLPINVRDKYYKNLACTGVYPFIAVFSERKLI